jgi:hypothetical protein
VAIHMQALPEVVRALSRLASAGVEVSRPGVGFGEQNVAAMPIGHLRLIAHGNLSNFNSVAPSLATEQLGTNVYKLLERGLASSTAGSVQRELGPLVIAALQPFAYHVATEGCRWLMRLWTRSSYQTGGELVRSRIRDVVEALLKAYRTQPGSMDRSVALSPLLDSATSEVLPYPTLPAGAAMTVSFMRAGWPPDPSLMEDTRWLADSLVRELLWPAAAGQWRDFLEAPQAMAQAVEAAALFAATATGTLRHPNVGPEAAASDSAQDDSRVRAASHRREEAAKHWGWLCRILLGTCDALVDSESSEAISMERWQHYGHALEGVGSCVWICLASQQLSRSEELEQALDRILAHFVELTEELFQKWGEIDAREPLIRYLRLIGAWMLATGRAARAEQFARLVASAKRPQYSWMDSGSHWSRTYPTGPFSDDWQPRLISVSGQIAVPLYWQAHEFNSKQRWELFDAQIEALGSQDDAAAQPPVPECKRRRRRPLKRGSPEEPQPPNDGSKSNDQVS